MMFLLFPSQVYACWWLCTSSFSPFTHCFLIHCVICIVDLMTSWFVLFSPGNHLSVRCLLSVYFVFVFSSLSSLFCFAPNEPWQCLCFNRSRKYHLLCKCKDRGEGAKKREREREESFCFKEWILFVIHDSLPQMRWLWMQRKLKEEEEEEAWKEMFSHNTVKRKERCWKETFKFSC